MTPLWLGSLLPAAELSATAWLTRRVDVRRYPALITYLLSESGWHVAAVAQYTLATRYAQPWRIGMRAWVIFEVFRLSCIYLNRAQRIKVVAGAVLSSLVAAAGMRYLSHLSPIESFFIARQYVHLMMAAAMWALCLGAWPRLRVVSRERSAYRWGVLAWMTVHALSGMFVRGGLGYMLAPYAMPTWDTVNVASYGALVLTATGLAWGMGRRDLPRRVAAQVADAWVRRVA